MDELRERIGEIYTEGFMGDEDIDITVGKTLALFSDYVKDVEWVGECYCTNPHNWVAGTPCPKCNGNKEWVRPATIEEVLRKVPQFMRLLEGLLPSEAFDIDIGQLRIKEVS